MIRKVLLVDDDPILRIALAKRLEAFGDHFKVVTAVDGFHAVKQLKQVSCSLIVLDLIMPRMDGMSLLAHIRDKYPDLPAIVISSMRAIEMQELVKRSGVLAYLSKPFQAEELVSVIMSSLRKEAAGGIMYDVSPTVFLQLMEMDQKTCTIRIFDNVSETGGVLYFLEGQLIDARVGDLYGIDAAFKVFTWDVVTLFIQNTCAPRDNVINRGLQSIILQAVGMKDESEDTPHGDAGDKEAEGSDTFFVEEREPTTKSDSSLYDIKEFLLNEIGEDCVLGQVFDENIGKIMNQLNELGAGSGFGQFQLAFVTSSKRKESIILPGQPAPVFFVSPNSDHDRIIEALRKLGQPPPDHPTIGS